MENKTAKEMFEELGYQYGFNGKDRMIYTKEGISYVKRIVIFTERADVEISISYKYKIELNCVEEVDLELLEIIAINQQMKELGRLND